MWWPWGHPIVLPSVVDLGSVDGTRDRTVTVPVRNWGFRPARLKLPTTCCMVPGREWIVLPPLGSDSIELTLAAGKLPLGRGVTDVPVEYAAGGRLGVANVRVRFEVRR